MHTIWGAAFRRRSLFAFSEGRDEAGFTLLELMVVVGVIGVLITVIMPTFVGARRVAEQRATQSTLTHALQAANIAYVDLQDFQNLTTPILAGVEPGLQFADASSSSPHIVAVSAGQGTIGSDPTPVGYVALAAPAGDGSCWYVLQTNDAAPMYGTGAAGPAGVCNAVDAQFASQPSFPL